MGVPEERYSRITNKNRREICLPLCLGKMRLLRLYG